MIRDGQGDVGPGASTLAVVLLSEGWRVSGQCCLCGLAQCPQPGRCSEVLPTEEDEVTGRRRCQNQREMPELGRGEAVCKPGRLSAGLV